MKQDHSDSTECQWKTWWTWSNEHCGLKN